MEYQAKCERKKGSSSCFNLCVLSAIPWEVVPMCWNVHEMMEQAERSYLPIESHWSDFFGGLWWSHFEWYTNTNIGLHGLLGKTECSAAMEKCNIKWKKVQRHRSETGEPRKLLSHLTAKSEPLPWLAFPKHWVINSGHHRISNITIEDGPMEYPANMFDSPLRGDSVPLGSSPTKSQKKKTSGWRPAIAFLYLFLFHSLLCLTSFLSQNKNQNNNREVRWVRGPGLERAPVSPVRTESDGPQKRLGEP